MGRKKYNRQPCQTHDSDNRPQQVSRTTKTAADQASPRRDFEGDPKDDSTRHDLTKKRLHQWQRVHIGLFMGAFLCSLAGILAFGMVLKNFELYCPLFANVSVVRDEDVAGNAGASGRVRFYSFDHATSSWGGKRTCDFCLFTTVSSFIYAFLWLWIFCSFSRKMENMSVVRSSPWKMVPPALFITCIFSLLVLTCAILLTVGQAGFCNSLERHTLVSCSDAQELPWKPDVIRMANFHTLFTRAEFLFAAGHLACGDVLVPQLRPAVLSLRSSPRRLDDWKRRSNDIDNSLTRHVHRP
ncbi:uncharacterized protein LOC119403142 [Rhipicephalus sanguineus]|uniref:uncharacterized protein LOC119403142 n=1 Tax=Rhipicephalus sanguineus TaxID=34632 RepID=UPI001895C885|nr:uncharacterized protein LOC119403142 [Rhipicephalus sanguineus]